MNNFRSISSLSALALAACIVAPLPAHAQPASAPGASGMSDSTNKGGKPPSDAAASQAGTATKKPSKQGAQSGAQAASSPDSMGVNKAAKPPTDEAASKAGVATKKPAKAGAQSGPMSASAPN